MNTDLMFVLIEFRLIINEGLEIGSQMAYIRRARAAGYAVIVTNTNLNSYDPPRYLRRSTTRSIRVNRSSFIDNPKCHSRAVQQLKNMGVMFGNILFIEVQLNMFVSWHIPMVVQSC